MFNIDRTPLEIIVTETDWYSVGDLTNPRHKYLHDILTKAGGVDISVPPGLYYFNVRRVGIRMLAELTPEAKD